MNSTRFGEQVYDEPRFIHLLSFNGLRATSWNVKRVRSFVLRRVKPKMEIFVRLRQRIEKQSNHWFWSISPGAELHLVIQIDHVDDSIFNDRVIEWWISLFRIGSKRDSASAWTNKKCDRMRSMCAGRATISLEFSNLVQIRFSVWLIILRLKNELCHPSWAGWNMKERTTRRA